jgi:2-haloacid dehalogenase
MAVRALVFDVFGTLVDWRSGVAAAFRDEGVAGDPEALADDWRARYAPILGEVIGGSRPWALLDELHHATLDDLLAEHGIEAPSDQRERLVQSWHRLDPWPDVREGLEALRRTYVLATLSNAHVAMLVDLARHGDLRFDTLLSAELAGAYKPSPEAYLSAARLLGLEPVQVMLVAAIRSTWPARGTPACAARSSTDRSSTAPARRRARTRTPTWRPRTCSRSPPLCEQRAEAIDVVRALGDQLLGLAPQAARFSGLASSRSSEASSRRVCSRK